MRIIDLYRMSKMLLCSLLIISFAICMNESRSILENNSTALENLNNCECVWDYQCHNGTINTRGIGIMTLRYKEENVINEMKCSEPSHVCCKTNFQDLNASRFNLSLTVSEPVRSNSSDRSENSSEETCGKPKPIIGVRIFSNGGDISSSIDGEFPWMTSIYRKKQFSDSFHFKCAGSLISDKVVLTAGHCVYGATRKTSEFKVIANAKKELSNIGDDVDQERDVERIVIHPQYYGGGAHNDIALMILQKSFNESKNLNSVCIPEKNSNYNQSRCLAAGWGSGGHSGATGEKILRKVELPIMDNKKCESLLKKTRLGKDFELHESFICAGGEKGKDTCKGDGGGPLVCPDANGDFTQVGIVSWGIDCAKENNPGVYTDVTKFRDWIKKILNENTSTISN